MDISNSDNLARETTMLAAKKKIKSDYILVKTDMREMFSESKDSEDDKVFTQLSHK